jgi:hypothetical protein
MVARTSSAESDTLAPEQSSLCRGVRSVELRGEQNGPEFLAYRSYYRAYLLQKGPRLGEQAIKVYSQHNISQKRRAPKNS